MFQSLVKLLKREPLYLVRYIVTQVVCLCKTVMIS
jgi:hypothetical protein